VHEAVRVCEKLPTGVPGLDEILGSGLPESSFTIVAGSPGCGKTTLSHQISFANAGPERPALYRTVLGEPAIKVLRFMNHRSNRSAVGVPESIVIPAPAQCPNRQWLQTVMSTTI